jgi:hypothetical protein
MTHVGRASTAVTEDGQLPSITPALVRCQSELLDPDLPGWLGDVVGWKPAVELEHGERPMVSLPSVVPAYCMCPVRMWTPTQAIAPIWCWRSRM